MSDIPQTEDPMVAALLRERAGYVGRKGKEDRVAAVDEQLELRGYAPDGERIAVGEDGGERAESRTTPPKGRQSRATDKA
ncbi:hypothetical protein [Streptomyces sp. SID12488]|uniref:hypothetical protein n=1 Tax=Streptomyces sp. SID12488 TaxID=2706040 RepID=UPI0013DB1288|nr:hypothetical protein [Streptomyces sp. SID12488]NEA61358.1 hypothetical protein [Streptomyces sp. SID12488]